jgi:tetratricopeptide (TPR) repeat protein
MTRCRIPLAQPTREQLDEIEHLYEAGLYLQAHRAAEKIAPLSSWTSAEARILAGRLAMNLGHPKLSSASFYLAWRQDRSHPTAANYHGRQMQQRSGPYAAWQHFRCLGSIEDGTPGEQADRLSCVSSILTQFRDFERAQRCMDRALEFAPDSPWLYVQQAHLLVSRDRREEALDWAKRSLALQRWYRPGIQAVAECFVQLARNDEAIELLAEASKHLESSAVLYQLMSILFIEERYEEARALLDRVLELSPLRPEDGKNQLYAWRSDLAYFSGDIRAAIEFGSQCPEESFQAILSERIRTAPADAPRKKLDVPFIQQNYMTCGPATLASIGPYWDQPIDHLEVARAICYDGTPDHEERIWAEENGWVVREFTVDWECAKALIDRGVPFTLSTVTPVSAHLQAVVGYDARRGTLLIRDPSSPGLLEFLAEEFLEHSRSTGPRGFVLVPLAEAARLNDLSLPDTVLFDHHFLLKRALVLHDREEAEEQYITQVEFEDNHPLTLRSRWTLALYDNDLRGCLEAVERLLELFPDDATLKLRQHEYLRQLTTRHERLAALEETCMGPTSNPVMWIRLADELISDPREISRAEYMLNRAIRMMPFEPEPYSLLARVFDRLGRYHDAFELSRIAASLGSTDEYLQREFCTAARNVKRHEEALAVLRKRADEVGEASSLPVRTLQWALSTWHRTDEGFEALERGLALRPDDDELMLYTAVEYARSGRFTRAGQLLKSARGKSHEAQWLLAATRVAIDEGRSHDALESGLALVRLNPTHVEGHSMVAGLLEQTIDGAHARAHLDEAISAAPKQFDLQILRIERLRGSDDAAAETALRILIDQDPTHAWSHRELVLCLTDQRSLEAALVAADEAVRLDPFCSASHHIRGRVLEEMYDFEGAAGSHHQALSMDIDDAAAMSGLVRCSRTEESRHRALDYIRSEIERQVVLGDALPAYRSVASQILEGEPVLELLELAREARPDLWQTWCESGRQLVDLHRPDDAVELLEEATRRYPRVGELWMAVAQAHEMRDDASARIRALEETVDASPGWSWAALMLAGALEEDGRLERAEKLLAGLVLRSPSDAPAHGRLASVLWQQGEKDRALDEMRRALTLDPTYEWGWSAFDEWCHEMASGAAPLDFAMALTEERPGDAQNWQALSRRHQEKAREDRSFHLPQALAAIDHAIGLNSHETEYHDARALILAEQGRYEEALAACRPPSFGPCVPTELRSTEAWIYAQAGRVDEAIESLDRIVAEDPAQGWAWQQLYFHHFERGDLQGAEAAATALVRFAPREGEPWAMLAQVLFGHGREEDAREALEKCLVVDSQQRWAASKLLSLTIESGRIAEAQELATRLLAADDHAELRSHCVNLAVKARDAGTAIEHYTALLSSPDADAEDLGFGTRLLAAFGKADEAWAALDHAIGQSSATAPLVSFWVQSCLERGVEPSFQAHLKEAGEDWQHRSLALSAYIEALAEHRKKRALRGLRKSHPDWFEGDTILWGSMGYAMIQVGDRQTTAWLKSWKGREGLQPWMLLNVALVAMREGRVEDAMEASRKALEVGPPERVSEHVVVLGFYEALESTRSGHTSLRPTVHDGTILPFYKMLHGLTQALHESARTNVDSREAFRLARDHFWAASYPRDVWKQDALAKGLRRQSATAIVKRRGGLLAWIWWIYI